MKTSLLALLLLSSPALAADVPYKVEDPAANENFRDLANRTAKHLHNNDGSGRLQDIIPAADSLYDVGASGREFANGYFDNITIGGAKFGGNPVGTVVMYVSSSTTPSGWFYCDGSSKSTTTYSLLFSVIGYAFGGSGANFSLPDFRGVFPKGHGTTNRAAGVDANGNAYAAVNGTYAQDKMQGHVHTIVDTTAAGVTITGNGDPAAIPPHNGTGAFVPITGSPSSDGTNGTPRTGLTTEPQSLGINFIIYAGL